MQYPKRRWSRCILLPALLIACFATEATTLDTKNLAQLADEAELIFRGTVVDLTYRSSEISGPNQIALPHTFVTFAIERIYKGRAVVDGEITLRFEGGPAEDGRLMLVPDVPLFDVGDRDFLFVKGNAVLPCPLVGWEQGRFRDIDGLVYADDGSEIWASTDGAFARGARRDLEQVASHRVLGYELRFNFPPRADSQPQASGKHRLDSAGLESLLEAKASAPAVPTAQFRTQTSIQAPSVPSADASKPFHLSVHGAVPPPST